MYFGCYLPLLLLCQIQTHRAKTRTFVILNGLISFTICCPHPENVNYNRTSQATAPFVSDHSSFGTILSVL